MKNLKKLFSSRKIGSNKVFELFSPTFMKFNNKKPKIKMSQYSLSTV